MRVRILSLATAGLCAVPFVAQPLAAQPLVDRPTAPPPGEELTVPPPPAEISEAVPAPVADAHIDGLPEVDAPDTGLFLPLEPLRSFSVDPELAEGVIARPADVVRFHLRVEGLGPTGLEGMFRDMSALAATKGMKATPAQITARTNADEKLLGKILRSEGWYDGRVDAIVTHNGGQTETDDTETDNEADTTRAEPVTDITFDVAPGERYHWREIRLDFLPAEAPELREGFDLKTGTPVRAAEIEIAEGALLLRLEESGYPFAKIGERDIMLASDTPEAVYSLDGETGPKGVFGNIRLRRYKPFDDDHAAVIARFRPGDPYNVALVDDLRRALIDTEQFGGVTLSTKDTGERDAEGRAIADIEVLGNRGPSRLLGGKIGYSTGEGVRAEGLWRHRNFVRPEGQFTARAVVGTIEQLLSAELAMNNWHQRDRILRFFAEVANTNRPAFQARTLTLAATLSRSSTHIWQKPISWSVGTEFITSDERDRSAASGGRRTFLIAGLPTMLRFDMSNSLLDPTRGARLTLWATPEIARQGGTTTTYGRVIAEASGYQAFGEKFVLAERLRVGSILGASRFDIAPTRRLYVGGGGSVRGFGYQQVGPHDANDKPTGGRGLLEGTIEGRYRTGNMGFVGFVEAGTLTERSTPTLKDVHVGVGVGYRYYTDFGPVRIDLARAITKTRHAPKLGLYISIGQAF